MSRGYFGIGIFHPKTETNVGSLFRTAQVFGASYLFTIGRRYEPQSSDTQQSWRHIPVFHFVDFAEFYERIPYDAMLVGVEMGERSTDILEFGHPERAVYLLGAEDHGLPDAVSRKCHRLVKLPGNFSLNVAVAGSIVIFDRDQKVRSRMKLRDVGRLPRAVTGTEGVTRG